MLWYTRCRYISLCFRCILVGACAEVTFVWLLLGLLLSTSPAGAQTLPTATVSVHGFGHWSSCMISYDALLLLLHYLCNSPGHTSAIESPPGGPRDGQLFSCCDSASLSDVLPCLLSASVLTLHPNAFGQRTPLPRNLALWTFVHGIDSCQLFYTHVPLLYKRNGDGWLFGFFFFFEYLDLMYMLGW